ncbi:MAG: SMC-Scp complex subunit ScpB [Bradymonadaceae bacterium]
MPEPMPEPTLDRPTTAAIIEALLLATNDPLPFTRFVELIPEAAEQTIVSALEELKIHHAGPHRGMHLVEINGGYRLRTNPAFGDVIRAMYETRPLRLSRAAMETLAIVAYRQPLTRAVLEEIRGVDCSGVLRTLQEYALTEVIGQLDDIGRPNLWGTTDHFLEFFGLTSLADLPTLEENEVEALVEAHASK